MKQCKFVLLTLVIVVFTGAALTHAGGAPSRPSVPAARVHSPVAGQAHGPFADTALQRWRLGGATHWRCMLLQH
jgi:hypothetical protein